jgi:hypothetical protein
MAIKLNPAGYRGIPDRMVLLPGGHMFFAEFKRPGQKPRPNQRRFLFTLKLLGFDAYWFSDTEDFMDVVDSYVE